MGRGIISGLVLGAVFAAVVLAAASLVLPLPEVPQPGSAAPVAEVSEAPAVVAEVPAAADAVADAADQAVPAPGSADVAQVTPGAGDAAQGLQPPAAPDAAPAIADDTISTVPDAAVADAPAQQPAPATGTEAVSAIPGGAVSVPADPEPAGAPDAGALAAVPAPAGLPGADVAAQPDLPPAEPEPEAAAVAAPPPEMVEVPVGSEFARGAGDAAPRLPATEAAPQTGAAPVAPEPAKEAAPALASTAPAARPEADTGPEAPAAPQTGSLAPLPSGEQPLPVPPAGEALAPELPPLSATVPDLPATPGTPSHEIVMPRPEATETAPSSVPEGDAPQAPEQPDIILVPEFAPEVPDTTPPIQPGFGAIPQPGFGTSPGAGFANAPQVVTDRLPSIGKPNEGEAAPAAPLVDNPAAPSALQSFRQPFTPTGAPMLSVVLLYSGPSEGGLDRDAVMALTLPLTIALDPMRPDATETAAAFRAAGFEVAILAAPLPEGATSADLEVALSAWRRAIPEAVAVIEPPEPVMQGNRNLAQQLVAALRRDGLGLVTQSDKGLNAAAQVASAAALPQASVWRVLDTGRDKAPAIMRYLDRARFEAARGAGVVVMLHGWPDSVQALQDWARSADAGIDLAPVSAQVLSGAAP